MVKTEVFSLLFVSRECLQCNDSVKGKEAINNSLETIHSFYFFIVCGLFMIMLLMILCLSGQEMAQSRQRPLLKDSWSQNSIVGGAVFTDPPIADITSVNVM